METTQGLKRRETKSIKSFRKKDFSTVLCHENQARRYKSLGVSRLLASCFNMRRAHSNSQFTDLGLVDLRHNKKKHVPSPDFAHR